MREIKCVAGILDTHFFATPSSNIRKYVMGRDAIGRVSMSPLV